MAQLAAKLGKSIQSLVLSGKHSAAARSADSEQTAWLRNMASTLLFVTLDKLINLSIFSSVKWG